ncbi:hypothetical protein Anas_12424 [Armadillidium nasatum]|uniref:Uncharacterized protein n=1 Tax=Armadillidium nasatum TaxID=96803 RepID=A0A5N5T368_9CRUS|nr:hypothetical protein Anas_04074 [Armadillidium nasatum]KAB7495561.1 hypothetical protein Anas_06398 [Armadillidium nasatum]KAB7500782.1 hypothetical protein Anas_13140 [Armadillidium nasatum]KAB7504268.1 hypothetical protein Anas_08414 [Armadillidium nasatum]KAB7505161.1 hypothetical protein Anas_12424 [Armadillidium nasatum]
MLHSERTNCQPFISGNIRISTSLFPNGRQIAETSFFLLELKIFIEKLN